MERTAAYDALEAKRQRTDRSQVKAKPYVLISWLTLVTKERLARMAASTSISRSRRASSSSSFSFRTVQSDRMPKKYLEKVLNTSGTEALGHGQIDKSGKSCVSFQTIFENWDTRAPGNVGSPSNKGVSQNVRSTTGGNASNLAASATLNKSCQDPTHKLSFDIVRFHPENCTLQNSAEHVQKKSLQRRLYYRDWWACACLLSETAARLLLGPAALLTHC